MSSFNRVILIGRIGNDPELKKSVAGKPYLKLSLATQHYRAGEEPVTHWHRVMVFGTQAEACATYLRKGRQVMVEGSLEVRSFTDKEERKVTIVSVVANRVHFMDAPKAAENEVALVAESQPLAESA